MDEKTKLNLTSGKTWFRLLYMILFALCLQVASVVMWVLVMLQFIFALLTGQDNEKLRAFGKSLSEYIYDVLQFLTYNDEEKPFPFSDWPSTESMDDYDADISDDRTGESSSEDLRDDEVKDQEVRDQEVTVAPYDADHTPDNEPEVSTRTLENGQKPD